MHREFASPYPAKLIIEKDYLRTENANRAKMIGEITPESYEPYPKNPKIAKAFKEIGLADEFGSGVQNLYKYTPIYSDGAEPELKENDIFRTVIPLSYKANDREVTKKNDQEVTKINDQDKILEFCKEPKKLSEIMEMMNFKHRSNFRKNYILPLVESGRLMMTIPDKPSSRNQKYYSK